MGDTDLFPALPELRFFADQTDEVVQLVARMNPGQYNPVSSMEVLTPKSALGFRIGHQLTASDSVIFTAAVVENGEGIEERRQRASGDVAFAYRFDPDGGPRLYRKDRSFHDWLAHLATFGGGDGIFEDSKAVLETDIADFYQRIYFHRIENVLQDSGASRPSYELIRRIIQVCRAKQSFGIPVGSSASRLLAEAVLSDTDKMLTDMGLEASRFMDDFRIVASSRYNAHTILCRLAEHLMVTEGLALNVSKTRITDTAALHANANSRLEDVFTTAEVQAFSSLISAAYGDEEHEEILHEEDVVQPTSLFLSGSDLLDRLDELHKRDADFSSRKAVLKVLYRLPEFDPLRLVRDHPNLAYQLPRDFCRALQAACKVGDVDRAALAAEVWRLLLTPPVSELAYARVWLLSLFAGGSLPVDRRIIADFPALASPLEERQLIFIRSRLDDRAYFRDFRGRLGQVGEWAKPALLMGAVCLPADEYSHWIDLAARQIQDPLARPFCSWLKQRRPIDELLSAG